LGTKQEQKSDGMKGQLVGFVVTDKEIWRLSALLATSLASSSSGLSAQGRGFSVMLLDHLKNQQRKATHLRGSG